MKVDNSYNRYLNKPGDPNRRRYEYSISQLFGDVLDVGCGDGYGAYLMSKNKDVKSIIGIDSQPEAVAKAKQNLKNIKASIITGVAEDLPFRDNTFDSVHCGQTLEHVKDDKKVVSEIHRVTMKRAVFSVPIHGGLSVQHVREYDNSSITELIKGYFNVISTKLFAGKYNRLVIVAEK